MDAVRFFRSRFRELGDAERAKSEKQYMKSELRFHGVSSAEVRGACRDFTRSHPDLSRTELREAVDALFATDYFDLRSAAVGLLERRVVLLRPSDAPWLVSLVRKASCWAHVDWLATSVVSTVQDKKRIRAWAKDRHLWVRRTALLALLPDLRHGGGDFALFEEIAVPMLGEKVFWIRKAIGWVLREVSKKRPALVRGFIARHQAQMSGLTLREAQKYL